VWVALLVGSIPALLVVISFTGERPVKVMVEDGEPCGATYEVIADSVYIKARPGILSWRLGQLHTGQQFLVCENQGEWLGIVHQNSERRCFDQSAHDGDYSGLCVQGWIRKLDARIVAG